MVSHNDPPNTVPESAGSTVHPSVSPVLLNSHDRATVNRASAFARPAELATFVKAGDSAAAKTVIITHKFITVKHPRVLRIEPSKPTLTVKAKDKY
jgi:hypothetical protein